MPDGGYIAEVENRSRSFMGDSRQRRGSKLDSS
jgi:hypothetical protein